ncbi:MAG: Divergent AAA domain protein [Tenericutes bacterium ADurb.BinA124]|nr:MAG: Divergent AAA domain protein [Tenericutes bacterium ADurb.BinA124]
MIWGASDLTREIVGTNFNYNQNVNNEPLQHYLTRNLNPSLGFYFSEALINNKRVVLLTISATKIVPTAFKDVRYIRISSSKENLKKHPEREAYYR